MDKPNEYKLTDRIHIRTNYRGFIHQLGMAGPITRPLLLPISDVINMLMGGMKMFQVDKATGKSVELTLQNVKDKTKFMDKTEKEKIFKTGNKMDTASVTGVPAPEKPVEHTPLTTATAKGDEPVKVEPPKPVEQTPVQVNHPTKAEEREQNRANASKKKNNSEEAEAKAEEEKKN